MEAKLPPFDDHARLFQLLQTNYYPTPLDQASLTNVISKYEQESKQWEETITSLQEQLRDANTKKEKVDFRLRTAKGMSALIRRIPEEVLGEIFYWCTRTSGLSCDKLLTFWPDRVSSKDAPFSLLQVCRRWKRIALQTPKLFTEIYLPGGYYLNNHTNPLTVISMSVAYSGTLPLEVYINPSNWYKTNTETFQLFGNSKDHMHRITTLVTSLGPHIRALLPEGTTTELPNLRRLEFIEKQGVSFNAGDLHIGQLIAKGLRMVDLGNLPSRLKLLYFGENLKHFRVGYAGSLEPSTLVNFFRQDHPNLESLDVNYEELGDVASIIIPPQPIHLPKLTNFSPCWGKSVQSNSEILQHVLSNLRTPKLKKFHLSQRRLCNMGGILPAILEWFRASKRDLHDLAIGFDETGIYHDDFNDLLKPLPSLSNLSLSFSSGDFSEELILLLNRQDNPELCPNLTSLAFSSSVIPLHATFAMIHSRASKLPNLTELKLLTKFHVKEIDYLGEDGELIDSDEAEDLLHYQFIDIYPQLTVYSAAWQIHYLLC